MGRKGVVRSRPGKALNQARAKGKRKAYMLARQGRRAGPMVVASPMLASGVSEASNSFALHSVLLGSNPNGARVSMYNSLQRILVVGEGDFSWALSLAVAMGGDNVTATCYDSRRELFEKYATALDNVTTLRQLGVRASRRCYAVLCRLWQPKRAARRHHTLVGACVPPQAQVLYDVDATALHTCEQLLNMRPRRKFHRVVFNFPHMGGGSTEEDVQANQGLLRGFFASAMRVISRRGGEIHVALRSNSFYDSWKIEEQATSAGVVLKRCVVAAAQQPCRQWNVPRHMLIRTCVPPPPPPAPPPLLLKTSTATSRNALTPQLARAQTQLGRRCMSLGSPVRVLGVRLGRPLSRALHVPVPVPVPVPVHRPFLWMMTANERRRKH